MDENNKNKAIAIFDMAIKISDNSPTDVFCWFDPNVMGLDVRIYWNGWSKNNNGTYYTVPLMRDVFTWCHEEISPDGMLAILEEIWEGVLNGQAESQS